MPCYYPLEGYRARLPNASGKYSITFNPNHGYTDMPMQISCGQCIGCRLEKSRQWALRCVHEASRYDHNSFITLTYDDYHLPDDGNLKLRDFQLFMKRLRKTLPYKIRYFHCGEYGDNFSRPHYHAILFNHDFHDKLLYKVTDNGEKLYTSPTLEKIWGKGFAPIGSVTFDSCAYVSRYCTKKIIGKKADEHYSEIDIITGEVFKKTPEYASMSNGIGKNWYKTYQSDVYPSDFIILNGLKMKPPKYYDYLLEKESPVSLSKIKNLRKEAAKKFADNNTYERLRVREEIQTIRAHKLKRNYENEI